MVDNARKLMQEWTQSESLRRHMEVVGVALRAHADARGEDPDLWQATGLLHDFDYELHPDPSPSGHPYVGVQHLTEAGWPDVMTDAIMGHADYTGTERTTDLAKCLYAVDELSGLIVAAVLVRPDRDVQGLQLKSLKKKFKDKAFAKGVHREDVQRGADALGVDLWEHAQFVLEAVQRQPGVLETR
jgi:predicted hydrolase (HD superfamily)